MSDLVLKTQLDRQSKAGEALIVAPGRTAKSYECHLCTFGIQSSKGFNQLLPAVLQPLSVLCKEKQQLHKPVV